MKTKKIKKVDEKVDEEVVEIPVEVKCEFCPRKSQISPLAVSFGQEDLNRLADKINEIIKFLN
jgi:hypothetical protein